MTTRVMREGIGLYGPSTGAKLDAMLTKRDREIDYIKKVVIKSAEERRYNAGMAGEHSDGGARRSIDELETWLDGIEYAKTGKTKKYGEILKNLARDSDPEYQQYLELKKKFEDD